MGPGRMLAAGIGYPESMSEPSTPAAPPVARRVAASEGWLPIVFGLALYGVALGLRLWGLTQSITADDQDWIRRAVDFAGALEQERPRDTYQSAHPGVPVLWIAVLVLTPEQVRELEGRDDDLDRLEQSPAYLPALFSVRRALASYAAMLVVGAALLVWRLFGFGPGVLSGLLLAAEPFLVAHGQLFGPDVLMAGLMIMSVLAALIYLDGSGTRAYLVGSGIAAGLALSAKAPAILLFGFVPLLALALALWRARHCHEAVRTSSVTAALVWDLLLWAGAAALVYVATWPVLWVDPLGTLTRLVLEVRGVGESPRRWGNFFLGQVTTTDDVAPWLRPLFYPVVTAFRLSPITCLGLLALAVAAGTDRGRGTAGRRLLVLAAYVVLFALMMTTSPKKIDRYLLPAYPALSILGALGLWWALRRLLLRRLTWPAVALLGAGQVLLVASVQPYALSFYNPLLGGAAVAQHAMIVGWGEGLDQVAAYLDQLPDAERIVVVSLYKDQIVPLYRGKGARLDEWRKADYLATYVNMDQRGLVPAPLQDLVDAVEPDLTVRINGVAYARLYRIPAAIREQPDPRAAPRPNAVPRP
jgi:4-amino-4-deoxy-L-arabinose transferase-like glycosyltransferase